MVLTTQERSGWLIIGGVVVFVTLVLGAFLWRSLNRPVIGLDNCVYEDKQRLRRKHTDQTVIIIDQSETLSASHKRQVKNKLIEYLADDSLLAINAIVMLYVFGKNDFERSGSGQALAPVAFLCKPPSSGNDVIENNKKIAKMFYDRFVLPMNAAIEQSIEVALGERSPILEMLLYVSRSQDIREAPGGQHGKTLIVVSDLLQHSESFTHYRSWTYDQFTVLPGRFLKADLRGWKAECVNENETPGFVN